MKKKVNKCWACKKNIKEGKLFCKKCEGDKKARKSTIGTYVIYHSV